MRSIFLIVRDIVGLQLSFDMFLDAYVPRISNPSHGSPLLEGHRVLIVQLGDVADRGPNTKAAYSIMRNLSRVLGCRVVSLLGNHELFTHAVGVTTYVTEEDIRNFGGNQAFLAAFSENGEIWKVITQDYNLAARVGDSLFLHAGVDLAWFDKEYPNYDHDGTVNIDKLNVLGRRILADRKLISNALFHHGSPVTTRVFNTENDSVLCNKLLPKIRTMFKVQRIFVGHMPDEKVRNRCNGGIYLTDFAMSGGMRSPSRSRAGYVLMTLNDGEFVSVAKNVIWADAIVTSRQLSFASVPKTTSRVVTTTTSTTTSAPAIRAQDIVLNWVQPTIVPTVPISVTTPAPLKEEGCCLPLAKFFRIR
jgi:hypothetical protein